MDSENSTAAAVKSFRAMLDGFDEEVAWQEGDVMLDSMLDAGLDPAFQCQDGHCGTCMVLLKSGEVRMRKNNVLSPRDLERGYILLCQSEPLTDDVSLDCDD
ncbi:MAG: 2Fe-2S iron-sulfur cluster binding domain-containing protein [Gammaproteobacteria bacterium]|nr:2Fe-2S iron-sulfur cluster binding domain-containing protein [Gammaproteobacteria bacterium]